MTSWEPVDIDCDKIADEDVKWDDDVMNDLEKRFEELRQYDKNFNESRDKDTREEMSVLIDATRHDIEKLVTNQIHDKLIILLNNNRIRFGIQGGSPILEPLRKYDNFEIANDGALTYIYKRTVTDLGNMRDSRHLGKCVD